MPSLSIKEVPEALAERLRHRAARNHRSLQGELMSILTQALDSAAVPAPSVTHEQSASKISAGVLVGTKSTEEVAAEVRKMWPEPIDSGPLALDIVRQERDAR